MKLIKTFFLSASLLLFSINISAQEDCNKILFLHLQFIKGTPKLISMNLVDGKLKIPKNNLPEKSGYSFLVLSNQNKILYKDNFDDPNESVYEYPGDNGEIKRTVIRKDTLYISIRVPYSENISKITMFKTGAEPTSSSFETIYELNVNHSLIKEGN